jgi:hypothetical protein
VLSQLGRLDGEREIFGGDSQSMFDQLNRFVNVVVDDFDEREDKYIARPPGQTPLADRLRVNLAPSLRVAAGAGRKRESAL